MRRVGSSGLPRELHFIISLSRPHPGFFFPLTLKAVPRVLSSISIRSRDSPVLKADSSRAQTPTRPAGQLLLP